jgi:hypothetical protein
MKKSNLSCFDPRFEYCWKKNEISKVEGLERKIGKENLHHRLRIFFVILLYPFSKAILRAVVLLYYPNIVSQVVYLIIRNECLEFSVSF